MKCEFKAYDKDDNLLVENVNYTIDGSVVTPINGCIIYKFTYSEPWNYKDYKKKILDKGGINNV